MKKRLFVVFITLSFVINAQQKQQDSITTEQLYEVVVTATKTPTNKKNIGKIVYQITPQMIAINQGRSVVDLLNEVPGIEMNGNYGTQGQNLGYYIRGGRNRQVLILIDGIAVSDPSSYNNDFDLRQLSLDQIEKIEIIKGAASTLYGSGAATGVINIILKKVSRKHFKGNFNSYIGTNASQEYQNIKVSEINNTINFNGTIDKFNYLLSLNMLKSGGLSAAESTDESIKFNEDPFYRYNVLLKLGYKVSKKLSIGVFSSYDEFNSSYDGYDFITNNFIDANNELSSIQKRIGITPTYIYAKGKIYLNAFYTVIDRNVVPTADVYEGKASGFDLYNTYNFNKNISLLAGISAQYNDMYQKTAYSSIEEGSAKQHFYDSYLSANFNYDNFAITVGSRLNIHDEYGSHLVYNINPSYRIRTSEDTNLKLMASYSTAYVTPTLQEFFNKLPTINKLNPEEDKTLEGGFEWTYGKKLTFNAVYFYREETNKIGYDYTTYQTINDNGTFLARGVEAEVVYNPTNKFTVSVNYGFIDRKKSLLLKIPKHKVNTVINYKVSGKTNISLNGRFVDATDDFGDIALPSYRLLDTFVNHSFINKRLTAFAGITNIFNEDYQEIAGFSTRGRNYKVGLQINF